MAAPSGPKAARGSGQVRRYRRPCHRPAGTGPPLSKEVNPTVTVRCGLDAVSPQLMSSASDLAYARLVLSSGASFRSRSARQKADSGPQAPVIPDAGGDAPPAEPPSHLGQA